MCVWQREERRGGRDGERETEWERGEICEKNCCMILQKTYRSSKIFCNQQSCLCKWCSNNNNKNCESKVKRGSDMHTNPASTIQFQIQTGTLTGRLTVNNNLPDKFMDLINFFKLWITDNFCWLFHNWTVFHNWQGKIELFLNNVRKPKRNTVFT